MFDAPDALDAGNSLDEGRRTPLRSAQFNAPLEERNSS
jgi:hypothetical protein